MAITNDVFTGPGGNTGGSEDLEPVVQEVWTDILQEPRFEQGTLINWATDLSEFMSEGGDIAHVPGIYTNEFTPKTQSTQGNEVDTESVAATDTTLKVDTHKYVAFMIGDRDMVQMAQKYGLNEAYVDEAKELLMKEVEDALFGLYSDISSYTVNNGSTPDQMQDSDVREAIEQLDSNEHVDPREEAALFLHPFVKWRQLGAVSKYYDDQKSNFDFLGSGNFGSMDTDDGLYNVPIFTSSRVQVSSSVYKNILCTREAFGFAIQTQFTPNGGTSRFRAQIEYRPENLATLAVVDVIYGVTTLRESDAVLIGSNQTAGQP